MTTKGRVKHFSVAPSDATLKGIVTGPDGALWVAQYVARRQPAFESGHSRYDLRQEEIIYGRLGSAVHLRRPDGARWFTESRAGELAGLRCAVRTASIRSNPEVSFPWGSRRVPMARSGSPAVPRPSG